jgi:hypothetical protein
VRFLLPYMASSSPRLVLAHETISKKRGVAIAAAKIAGGPKGEARSPLGAGCGLLGRSSRRGLFAGHREGSRTLRVPPDRAACQTKAWLVECLCLVLGWLPGGPLLLGPAHPNSTPSKICQQRRIFCRQFPSTSSGPTCAEYLQRDALP